MARTLRKQVVAYVTPEVYDWIVSKVESSDHNRETISAFVERILLDAMQQERKKGIKK